MTHTHQGHPRSMKLAIFPQLPPWSHKAYSVHQASSPREDEPESFRADGSCWVPPLGTRSPDGG